VTADPHLEEVVPYSSTVGRAALQIVPALGGFLAALVLLPSRWLAITVLFVSLSCLFGLVSYAFAWRKLRRRLAAAPAVPHDSVEVARRESGVVKDFFVICGELALLLGAGWLGAAMDHAPFALGLVLAAALLGRHAVEDAAERWSIDRWERRHGRILRSLLFDDEVVYVERGLPASTGSPSVVA